MDKIKESGINNIEIYYWGTDGKSLRIDENLDNQITAFFNSLGFERWASGYNYVEEKRDIAFEHK